MKTAQSSKSFSCASRIYRLFRFGAATRASEATTVIPRKSEIVPKLGGCRAILHISGCGRSLKTARNSKSFSCASRIYLLFRFGAATRASEATTVIPRTSEIVPKLGGCRALGHILGCGWSLKTARVTPWGNEAGHLDRKTLGKDFGARSQQRQEYHSARPQRLQADQLF